MNDAVVGTLLKHPEAAIRARRREMVLHLTQDGQWPIAGWLGRNEQAAHE